MSSCAALEMLHPYTGAVPVRQSLELWICCLLDMLGSHPSLLVLFNFRFKSRVGLSSFGQGLWLFCSCVYLPVWLARYMFNFSGSFGISLKSD